MKYMGSKSFMLKNGMGELLKTEAGKSKRFVDLFSGSGAVSFFVATQIDIPVISVDIQEYSKALALSVTGRTTPLSVHIVDEWIERASTVFDQEFEGIGGIIPLDPTSMENYVSYSRHLCETNRSKRCPIFSMYGGHYFSSTQALWIDALLRTLPRKASEKNLCLSSLIATASQSAAAPGHTAQPFQPTETGGKFIAESWKRDICSGVKKNFSLINSNYAKQIGIAVREDAQKFATNNIAKGDLVFVDPPYSGVQYSRFYHVLEAIAQQSYWEVGGVGRYPEPKYRPQSAWSNKGQSFRALDDLLQTLAQKGAVVIFTFPKESCSNGLSGELIAETAKKWFSVEKELIARRASTLG